MRKTNAQQLRLVNKYGYSYSSSYSYKYKFNI